MFDPNRRHAFAQGKGMIVHEDRRSDFPRKDALMARRLRQRDSRTGFFPNQSGAEKFNEAVKLLSAKLQGENKYLDAGEATARAAARVRGMLPKTPIGVRTRPFRSRSKY